MAAEPEGVLRRSLAKGLRAAARKLLPEAVIDEVRRYRVFTSRERTIYLRKRVLNRIGVDRPKVLLSPHTIKSVIFVCFGNIIRSPMCEALLIRELAGLPDVRVAVSSAGLRALPGRPAHPWAVAAAREQGISLEDHRARLLTDQMIEEADAIFAMDYQNEVQLLSRWAGAKKKIYMLGVYAGQKSQSIEIPDPYYLGRAETSLCYDTLQTCIERLAGCISEGASRGARGGS